MEDFFIKERTTFHILLILHVILSFVICTELLRKHFYTSSSWL